MEPPVRDDNQLPPDPPQEQPKTSIPRIIGILNIVFGSLLLVCVVCNSLYMMIQVAIGEPIMAMQQVQFQEGMKAERERKLRQLHDQEKASNDEKEKGDLRAKQKALEEQPLPKMPDFSRFIRDTQVQWFMAVDYVTASVLNILMVISGIALLRLKEWGRVTANWVAAIKIIRLVAVYGFFALVLVPALVKDFNSMFEEFFDGIAKAAPGQKAPGPQELAWIGTFLGITWTVSAVGMIIFGAIYPIIVLIALTRPRVKAACASPPAKVPK